MPRPTNKTELLAAASARWEKLWALVDSMTEQERQAAFCFGEDPKRAEAHWARDRNLRDVLVHLYEWHQLLLDWIAANFAGRAQPFLPPPYTWKTYGEMNAGFWQKHQATPYGKAEALLRESHAAVLALVESLTDEELFEKQRFSWTGTTNIGSYCVSVTSSHYDWAIKKLKLHVKTIRQ